MRQEIDIEIQAKRKAFLEKKERDLRDEMEKKKRDLADELELEKSLEL